MSSEMNSPIWTFNLLLFKFIWSLDLIKIPLITCTHHEILRKGCYLPQNPSKMRLMLRYILSHINLHKFMTTETDSWYPQVILIGNERTKNLTSLINDFEIESYDNSQAAVKIITLYCQVDKMSIYLKRQNHTFTIRPHLR